VFDAPIKDENNHDIYRAKHVVSYEVIGGFVEASVLGFFLSWGRGGTVTCNSEIVSAVWGLIIVLEPKDTKVVPSTN
jgi:hypothetical protein